MSNRISFAKYSKVALVGGWTGWHVLPIISLVEQHRDFSIDYVWIGWSHSLEKREAEEANIPFFRIATIKLSSMFSLNLLLYPFVVFMGIFQARSILLREKPEIVFSKGGPGSLSVGLAAWLLMIPLWIHESDTIPWRSNKILGIFAEKVFLWFVSGLKYFPKKKCTITGQILHPDLEKPPKKFKYWKTTKSHVLVLCGSQWSRNIFRAIADRCRGVDVEWIILLGLLNTESRPLFHRFKNITLYDWIDPHTLGSILRDTDLVITRWSATTLAEVDRFGVRKLMIPLPWSSSNHQFHNAKWYEEARWDIILEESDIKSLNILLAKTLSTDIIDQSMERSNDFLR
jgi:UDP-N-acetylglucosamine--N-acetylmuramyl-(pentapeptide) pyrophosphoryl-undecaprenol N-acetylglucosamine transferase